MSNTGRMRVGLVGNHPSGVVVANSLGTAGHQLVGQSILGEDRIEQADALLLGAPILDVAEIFRRSELIILAATGEALLTLIIQISDLGLGQEGQLVSHLSSDHGVEILSPLSNRGLIPLRLFPMVPLTGTGLDVNRLKGAWCAVSAPTPALPIAQALSIEMGMEPLVVSAEQENAFSRVVETLQAESVGFIKDAVDALEEVGLEEVTPAISFLAKAAVDGALRERTMYGDLLREAEDFISNAGLDDD